jgi:hypothetical protein
MSMARLNRIVMSGILPFNFGMDYDAWLKMYQTESLRSLVGSDPATWTPEEIEEVNKIAKEENDLFDRLMSLGNEEFNAEVDRLSKEKDGE